MEKEEVVLLIDADSLIYYEAFKESLEEAIIGIRNRINRIFEENETTKYVMFLTEGRCFRYATATSKEYKGNRKDRKKPKWFNVLKSLLKDEYGALSIKELEADDCVAFFGNIYPNMRICSPDKDVIKQCEGRHYNYQMVKGAGEGEFHSKGMIDTSEEDAISFLHLQMLMGDSTDGISGIEGVGPKKAEKILEAHNESITEGAVLLAYIDKYGAIDGISRFAETFKLVYLLKTEEDMMREIKYIPELPEIQDYTSEEESTLEWE